MIRRSRLVACVSSTALAAALLGPTVTGAEARTANTLLPSANSSTLTPAARAAISHDMVAYAASGGGQRGFGPLLTELSQAPTIKGTRFGGDLATLGTECSEGSNANWRNFVAGAHALQADSSEYPAPFSTFFYNLGSGLLKLYYD